ncbi:amidohydrolase family protein [Streptomyces sp. NBC_00588]|uniref:amidohydrolase family protein n=1 Tax=Streptomyces sp. NBC_00588 TaxID=2975784 RepID=UPI002E81809C|nr:amidohydrolase family protein [Streptomyces sp. NBC_00588]WUB34254.1 amidohydrolase [Streptomyces sp. NBC_00588]
MHYFDTHTHAISSDTGTYPSKPLGGTHSQWSRQRPADADQLVRSLDAAGVERAALVQASTFYGFDNSYAADALRRFPDRLVGVCSVDFLADTAVENLRYWIEERGFRGVRIRVSDGTTKVPTPGSGVSDERMRAVWDYVSEQRIPVCIQMHSKDAPKLAEVLETRPGMTVLLDHAGRPDASGGAPYPHLAEIGRLARFEGVHLKVTPPALRRLDDEPGADATEVLRRLVGMFGAERLMWGSNFPASEGSPAELRDGIEARLSWLEGADRAAVLGGNAARVYEVAVGAR